MDKLTAELAEALEERQWSTDPDEHGCRQCSECYAWDWHGHKPTCKLAALLKRAGKNPRMEG